MNFKQWLKETDAVYDGTKPKDGGGFNWYGAVGDPMGVSIAGDPIKHKKRKKIKKHSSKSQN